MDRNWELCGREKTIFFWKFECFTGTMNLIHCTIVPWIVIKSVFFFTTDIVLGALRCH